MRGRRMITESEKEKDPQEDVTNRIFRKGTAINC
jgi:hypothetical protein